jgi:radical SAM protein with 4Fe4S-binding SPASM domain
MSASEIKPPNDIFCILPWIHLNTSPNGNVYQCCITNMHNTCGKTTESTLEKIWNNEYMRDLRVKMLEGVEHHSCDRCYMLERNGLQSFRQAANEKFSKHIPEAVKNTTIEGHVDKFKLVYWDFRFSNLCNLKCRMCGHGLSSSWYDDHVKSNQRRGIHTIEDRVIHIDNFSTKTIREYLLEFIDTVEEVYFAGGEPLIMEEHYFILDELIARGRTDVRIRYNTNLTKLKYKNWNVMDYWRKFSDVNIFASIDAMDNLAEYIRSGTNWHTLANNIKTVVQFDPVILGANITLQILNIFQLPKLMDYLLSQGVVYQKTLISNVVNHPPYYSIQILPDHLKKQVEQLLLAHLNTLPSDVRNHFKAQYKGVVEFMYSPIDGNVEKLRKKFREVTLMLDGFRNEDFASTCPELVEWFNSIE